MEDTGANSHDRRVSQDAHLPAILALAAEMTRQVRQQLRLDLDAPDHRPSGEKAAADKL